jgi:hypothetical protein
MSLMKSAAPIIKNPIINIDESNVIFSTNSATIKIKVPIINIPKPSQPRYFLNHSFIL